MENNVLRMENIVLNPDLAGRSLDRTLEARRAAYQDEIRRLIEAAFASIRESGQLTPKVSELVRRSGLSNKSFYRHFRSRDELLVAVLDRGIQLLAGYLEHRMQGAATPLERIRAWLTGMTRQALDPEAASATRPFALSRAALSEGFAEEVRGSEARLTAPLRVALAEARDAGVLPGADPERDAELLYDLTMGWLQRRLGAPDPADPADAEHLVAFALAGLSRRAAPAPEAISHGT